jgi:hypothetical protein
MIIIKCKTVHQSINHCCCCYPSKKIYTKLAIANFAIKSRDACCKKQNPSLLDHKSCKIVSDYLFEGEEEEET